MFPRRFFALFLWFAGFLLFLCSTIAHSAEEITLRSGNGSVGSQDSNITFLARRGPFSSADFELARTGGRAWINNPYPTYVASLPADPLAKWIAVDTNFSPQSALYAYDFQVNTQSIASASLDLIYAVDNQLGEPGIPGLYINGQPVTGTNFVGDFGSQHTLHVNNIASLLKTGKNTLYFYQYDYGGFAGSIFSAHLSVTQNADISLGVVDQRTWVSNVSEFTVNIKNTGIKPQTLTSAIITGSPWFTLLTPLPVTPLQPGDQYQLAFRLAIPNAAIGGGNNSPVVFPSALEVVSNSLKYSENFQIQLYQNPVTQIRTTVLDDVTQQPVAGALVAFDNGANLYQTDQNGQVLVEAVPGVRTVFAYAPNHLPDQQTLVLTQGGFADALLSLKQGQALAVSNVTAVPLTLAQIQARGINLSDPSNFFIYDFVVKMKIGDVTAPNIIIPAHPAAGSTIAGGFGGGYYSFYFPTGDPTVRVETWIVIEGDIRVLKQFWDATVFINNNTNLPINNVAATLTIPTGLSLPPLFGQSQPAQKSLGNIAPMSRAQAEWVVRGDLPGVYELTGTATGTLALGGSGVSLASTLRSNPVTVVAPRLGVTFDTPDNVVADQQFILGINITNHSSIDLTKVLVHIKPERLINCVLAPGQSDTIDLGGLAIEETRHMDVHFVSHVTGKVLEVQSYVSPNPEVAPDVTVNAAKVKAGADTATTVAGTLVNIPVLTNDVGDTTLTVDSVTQPLHGTVTTNGLQAFYTPAPGFVGPDYFSYTVRDTNGNLGTANVAVTVTVPTPSISGTSPGSSLAGTPGFDLIVNGSGFLTLSQASWNGASRNVTFISPTQIKVSLLSSDLASAGLSALEVTNPGAGSAVASYPVYNANHGAPVLTATIGTFSRDSNGNILVSISIANTGQSDALNAGISAATLKGGAGLLNVTPASSAGTLHTIFIGTTQQYTLVFPGNVGNVGAAAILQFTFGPAGGSSQTRSQRVTLP